MSGAGQLQPYENIAISVQLMYDAVLFVVKNKPGWLNAVTTSEHSRYRLTVRFRYLDQLYYWTKLLYNKQESLTEEERDAHKPEFERIYGDCQIIFCVLITRLNE